MIFEHEWNGHELFNCCRIDDYHTLLHHVIGVTEWFYQLHNEWFVEGHRNENMGWAGVNNCVLGFFIDGKGAFAGVFTKTDTLNFNWPEEILKHLKFNCSFIRTILHLSFNWYTNVESRLVSGVAALAKWKGLSCNFTCIFKCFDK
jgi:hypothetical protein